MSKRVSKYIAYFNHFDKSLIILSATGGSISISSFATVTGATVGIASANFSLAYSMSPGIIKKLWKTIRNKIKNHKKTVMLARSEVNSIKSKISEVLIDNEIGHEDFMTIINEEKNYRELKESITTMKSRRNDSEKNNLIEEGKKIGIDEIIKRNEITNNSLKSQI